MSSEETEESKTAMPEIQIAPNDDEEQHKSFNVSGVSPEMLTNKKTWSYLEVLYLVGAAIVIAGMSLFLQRFDGLPLPSWSTSSDNSNLAAAANHVNPTSILELFSSTIKLLLIYPLGKALTRLTWVWFVGKEDRKLTDITLFHETWAQKPVAATKLIFMLKGRHLAAVAALIILALQIFGFFVQQLFNVRTWWWPDMSLPIDSNAKPIQSYYQTLHNHPNLTLDLPPQLQLAQIANVTTYDQYNGAGPYYDIGLDMKSNFWAGLYSTDPFANFAIPNYYCSSGNCTWSDYSSLGVCSKCVDIHQKLNITCSPNPSDLNATGCDVSLPNGFTLGGPDGIRTYVLATSTDYAPLVYNNYTDPIAIIQTIAAYNTYFINTSSTVSASECVLTPCMINYANSSLSSSPDYAKFGYNGIPWSEFVDSINDDYTFSKSGFPNNGTTIQNGVFTDRPSNFQMSWPAYAGLKYYLQSLFNGYVVTDGKSYSYQGDNNTRQIQTNPADAMEALYSSFTCYDIFGTAINDSAVCSIHMSAVAMTTVVRNNLWQSSPFLNVTFAFGQTITAKPTILVSWLWLVPIVGLWILCLLSSFLSIWKVHRTGVPAMELNPLTFLFLNVENAKQEPSEEWWLSEENKNKAADAMQVRLAFNNRKIALVQSSM